MFKKFPNYNTLTSQLLSITEFSSSVNRDTFLTPYALNHRLYVYNGQFLKSLLIKPYHVNFKLGQFIFTRLQTSAIHLRKRKKKEKKKRGKK